jgi:hypothetical protein
MADAVRITDLILRYRLVRLRGYGRLHIAG